MSYEPTYQVLESHGKIELRKYAPFLVAEVITSGERREAIRAGFRILAAFIFGGNAGSEQIKMSIPVTQQKKGHFWEIRFMMPKEFTEKNLPKPNHPEIKIQLIQSKRFAAIVFSGIPTEKKIKLKTKELAQFCRDYHWQTIGDPIYAFYNLPWTIPFLRRNEIIFELNA